MIISVVTSPLNRLRIPVNATQRAPVVGKGLDYSAIQLVEAFWVFYFQDPEVGIRFEPAGDIVIRFPFLQGLYVFGPRLPGWCAIGFPDLAKDLATSIQEDNLDDDGSGAFLAFVRDVDGEIELGATPLLGLHPDIGF